MARIFSNAILIFLVTLFCELIYAVDTDIPLYPSKTYSSPPVYKPGYFDTLNGLFLTGGDPIERARNFHQNTLERAEKDGTFWAHWQVKIHPERSTPTGIYFVPTVEREPEAFSFEVLNASEAPIQLGMFLYESQWLHEHPVAPQSWHLLPEKVVEPGERTVLTYLLANRQSGVDTDREFLLFPLNFSILVLNPENHDSLDIYLRDLTIHYGEADDVQVTRFDAPEKIDAGAQVELKIQIDGDLNTSESSLELYWQERVLWRMWLADAEYDTLANGKLLTLTTTLPWYIPEGEVEIGLVVDGYRATGEKAVIQVLQDRVPALPKVERRMFNGRPTVFLNGEVFPWSYYASYAFTPGNVSEFGASGANVFVPPTVAGNHIHDVAAPTWLPDGSFDFSEIDERVGMALQANPDAYVMLRLFLGVPNWWIDAHPDVAGRVRSGELDVVWDTTGSKAFSIASPTWQDKQEELLREALRYCIGQPWAERILGFMLVSGVTEEWFGWAAIEAMSKDYYSDYGVENEAAFLQWCEDMGLDVDEIPVPAAREGANRDLFSDSREGLAAAAYARFNSVATAEAISRFCRVAKEETDGRSLTGTLFGYIVQLAGEPRQHMAGNFALREVLDCPHLDMLMGIPLHNFRDLTNGYDLYVSATESILDAGKMFANENDLFSWLHHAHWYKEYLPEDPRLGAIHMHRRVLGNDAVHGTQRGWFSLLANWHQDDQLQEEFARQIEWHRESHALDRSGVEEVAFLVDDVSFGWYTPNTPLPRHANIDMLYAFGRTGAPVGVWLLSDIDRLPEHIRLVIVAHAPAASPDSIAKLEQALETGGRSFIITGPVGIIDGVGGEWDMKAPARILGLAVKVRDEALQAGVVLPDNNEAVYPDLERFPRSEVEASNALAWYADGAGAVAYRVLNNGGHLVWSGVPLLNNTITRSLLEAAGVHFYAPQNFTVHAARELVSITAPNAQTVTLSWPEAVHVTDWFTGWNASGTAFECAFEDGQTRLFQVERVLQTD